MNIIDRLDEYMTRGKDRVRKSHYPSDVTACLRQLAYKWNNVPESDPPTPGNFIKMQFGNMAEEHLLLPWLEWELEQGTIKSLDTQVEITGRELDLVHPIHGYQDFVIEKLDGTKVGIECKSSFGRGIVDIQRTGEPKPEHLMQIYLYLIYGECAYYYLVYVGRDNGYRCQFEVKKVDGGLTYNGKFMQINHNEMILSLSMAEATIGGEVLPDPEYKAAIRDGEIVKKFQRNNVEYKSDWQCEYCNHRSLCYKKQLENGLWYGRERIA